MVTYGYDAVGNRTSEVTANPAPAPSLRTSKGVFDSVNRLTTLTDNVDRGQTTMFTWDPNGNQRTRPSAAVTTEYRYDIRDQMVEVAQGASILGRFQYDFEGRRIQEDRRGRHPAVRLRPDAASSPSTTRRASRSRQVRLRLATA